MLKSLSFNEKKILVSLLNYSKTGSLPTVFYLAKNEENKSLIDHLNSLSEENYKAYLLNSTNTKYCCLTSVLLDYFAKQIQAEIMEVV